ncbi:6-carboxytetrahydropterin synthase [Magnetospirillum fulvum]|jgi:6-pyruvoyltetrahydropterin/6-carboxytetrahydropterin synthase|uniref:6-carboxy-5,6,7,8-tetrahydropterin synthase n=1 Tax=Magnetospirillum fulvum MGU-K5 TaxID=1316936 RepID=S9S9T0_MAGFU|nr:6-carboxytetrahydropterin synthase [Magnetospirillum fulvum]EPY00828.1 6-pyruvoyl-tetrahydropterin synthase [Magnetospirillum fulvum MGU-K5]
MSVFHIRRRIEIDAGHRIATHGSKCRNLHGHRYGIEAECAADALHDGGEQTDMAIDFAFLKEEMMARIDATCDHGLIVALSDVALLDLFAPDGRDPAEWRAGLAESVARDGAALTTETKLGSKIYVVPFHPTAEALARHWFAVLEAPVVTRSGGAARLIALRVWETPNCMAEYAP